MVIAYAYLLKGSPLSDISHQDNQVHTTSGKRALEVANDPKWTKADLGYNRQVAVKYPDDHHMIRESTCGDDHLSKKTKIQFEGESDGEKVVTRRIAAEALVNLGIPTEYEGKVLYCLMDCGKVIYNIIKCLFLSYSQREGDPNQA